LTIIPKKGYELKTIVVKDKKGHVLNINRNENAPYAPLSFNFKMPEQEVVVSAVFIPHN